MSIVQNVIWIRDISYINKQRLHYLFGEELEVETSEHPGVILEELIIQGEKHYIVAKFQSYSNQSRIMTREVNRGRATIITESDGMHNDSYYFSGEVYLVNENQTRIDNQREVTNEVIFRVNLCIAYNHTPLMLSPYITNIVISNMNQVLLSNQLNQLIINKHNDYQKIINDNVLPYCQFIDNNIYTNLYRFDRLIDNQ